ncbi:MAG: HNH endonuclease [Actinomycetia bacterium]|nr:HNH endonuclease [Actinomycetes bacterium]
MSNVKNRIPSLPVLRDRFIADFEAGTLTANPDFKGRRGQQKAGKPCGHVTSDGRTMVGINGKQYPLTRVLWKMWTGRDPGPLYIDHINGDVADNSISNLRTVTPGENRMNSRPAAKSGHKGLHYYEAADGSGRWRVQLCRVVGRGPVGVKGSRDGLVRKTYSYGTFKSLAAAKARHAEVIQDWGIGDLQPRSVFEPVAKPLPDDPNDLKPGDNWLNDMVQNAMGAA